MANPDLLRSAYDNLKIIICDDLNMRKFAIRRGSRQYTHRWICILSYRLLSLELRSSALLLANVSLIEITE